MTKNYAARVDLQRLKIADAKFASGGQADVFALLDDRSTVFKQFFEPEKHDWDAIEGLVALPATLAPHERALIENLAAWPISVVTRNNQRKGTLMKRIPATCRVDVRTQKRSSTIDAKLSQLMFPDQKGREVLGVTKCRTIGWKLRTLLRSAQFLELLHKNGLRFGDISDANWLFNTAAALPFFIDCDGIRASSESASLHTPDWDTAHNLGGIAGDNYRFFIGAYRLIGERGIDEPSADGIKAIEKTFGQSAIINTLRAALQSEHGAISPAEWISALWASMEHATQHSLVHDLIQDAWSEPVLQVVPESDRNFSGLRKDALQAYELEARLHALLASPNPELSDYLDIEDSRSAAHIARFRVELFEKEKTIAGSLTRNASEPSTLADLVRSGHHRVALNRATSAQVAPSHLLNLAFRMHLGQFPLEDVRIVRKRYSFLRLRPGGSRMLRVTIQWKWPQDSDVTAARVQLNGEQISISRRNTNPTETCHLIASQGDKISIEAGGIPPGRIEPIFESSQSHKEAA